MCDIIDIPGLNSECPEELTEIEYFHIVRFIIQDHEFKNRVLDSFFRKYQILDKQFINLCKTFEMHTLFVIHDHKLLTLLKFTTDN